MKAKSSLIIFFVSLIILFSLSVHSASLAINPGHTTLFYEPGKIEPVWFEARNTDNTEKYIKVIPVSSTGVQDIVVLQNDEFYFPPDSTQTIPFLIKMPLDMPYGEHQIKIRLMPITPPSKATGQNNVAAIELVNYLINLYVPYPGKYLKIILRVPIYNKLGEGVKFDIEAINLGSDDLTEVQGFVDIILDDKVVRTIETEKISIKSRETKFISAGLETEGMVIGRYKAVARVRYDGNSTSTDQYFFLGDLYIEIINISRSEFENDKINKYLISVQNKWSEPISDVHASVSLLDGSSSIIPPVDTQSVSINKWDLQDIPAFIDTAGVEPGEYDLDIILHYQDKTNEKKFRVNIIKPASTQFPISFSSLNAINLSIGFLVVIILVNIFWFIFKRQQKKRRE